MRTEDLEWYSGLKKRQQLPMFLSLEETRENFPLLNIHITGVFELIIWFQNFCTLTAKNKLLWKWGAVYVWAGVTLHILEVSAKKERTSSQPRRGTGPTSTPACGRHPAHGKEVQESPSRWGGQGVIHPFKRSLLDFLADWLNYGAQYPLWNIYYSRF